MTEQNLESTEPVAREKTQFPCKQCGADMTFDPTAAAQKCPYCGFENKIPQSESDIQELDFDKFISEATQKENTIQEQTVHCNSCGSNTTIDPKITATACPFCGSAIVAGDTKAIIKPKSLLPFSVTKDAATAAFKKWISKLWFAPTKVTKISQLETPMNGIYVPYWTFDSNTMTWYSGERGIWYYVTESYTTTQNGRTVMKTRQVRKTRWIPVRGTVWKNFDDVLVVASKSLPPKQTKELEPWDLKNLVNYSDEYLGGFRSECYQVDLKDGFGIAKKDMDDVITTLIKKDIGGNEQRIYSRKTQYDKITFKHILLPVWISAFKFGKKVFRVVVNARTGEIQGERPWSIAKIAGLILGIGAVIGTIVYFAR